DGEGEGGRDGDLLLDHLPLAGAPRPGECEGDEGPADRADVRADAVRHEADGLWRVQDAGFLLTRSSRCHAPCPCSPPSSWWPHPPPRSTPRSPTPARSGTTSPRR